MLFTGAERKPHFGFGGISKERFMFTQWISPTALILVFGIVCFWFGKKKTTDDLMSRFKPLLLELLAKKRRYRTVRGAKRRDDYEMIALTFNDGHQWHYAREEQKLGPNGDWQTQVTILREIQREEMVSRFGEVVWEQYFQPHDWPPTGSPKELIRLCEGNYDHRVAL